MKKIAALFVTALAAAPAFGHEGHDHSAVVGGEAHLLVWGAVGVAATLGIGFAVTRRARSHGGTEKVRKQK